MTSSKRIVSLLLLIAAVPRVISLATFDFIDSGGGSDSIAYLVLARNIFSGRGYSIFGVVHTIHHPFYPILIGLVNHLFGDLVFSALLVSCVSGILLVVPVYLMAAGMFGRRTGFLAGLMTALFPIFVYGSVESFSESLYTLLLISGLAAGWLAFKAGGFIRPLFSGIFLGLGFLTHPLGIAFLPLVAGFNLLVGRRRDWWRERIRTALLIVLAFSLTALPFWIFLRSTTGHWQLSGSSHYQDIGLRYVQAQGMEESQIIFNHMEMIFNPERAGEFKTGHEPLPLSALVFRHPDRLIRVIHYNLMDGVLEAIKTARYLSLPPGLFIALLLGGMLLLLAYFILNFIRGHRRLALAYLILTFAPLGIFLIMIVEHRYFYPFIPLALIVFSRIIDDILTAGAGNAARRRILAAGLILYYLALAAASGFIVYRKAVKAEVPYEYKILGTWMKENIPGIENEKVMAFRLGVNHYAGSGWNVFYWGDLAGLRDYLAEREINYLVVDEYKLYMLHPELRFLLDADPLPRDFSLVRESVFDGRKIRLLRFDSDRR
ncbi:MAG: glycosyltransferase family 39 protein [Candidatus Erginobacter occultus]|nr:glycosyltransferase family 39 protein [Candidatus Erginobacter occultus]